MTIGIAIKGKNHVVLASDTCRTESLGDGIYQSATRKVFRFNGTWAIGVAGALEGIQPIKNCGEGTIDDLPTTTSLSSKIEKIRDRLFSEYQKLGGTETVWFLLVGVENQKPFIYYFGFIKDKDNNLMVQGPFEQDNFSAIGSCLHGAMYFRSEFCKDVRGLEQNILWSFHCIAEVAKHDPCVKRPMDFMVVWEGKLPDQYSDADLPEFDQRSKEITQMIHKHLTADGLTLPTRTKTL